MKFETAMTDHLKTTQQSYLETLKWMRAISVGEDVLSALTAAIEALEPPQDTDELRAEVERRCAMGSRLFAIGAERWAGASKLTEECGEVIQVIGKLMGTYGDTDHWSGDLREMLVDELGDLQAALTFFIFRSGLDRAAIYRRADAKLDTVERLRVHDAATGGGHE